MDQFSSFSLIHGFTLLGCVVAIGVLVAVGVRRRAAGTEGAFRRGLGWFGLGFFVLHQIYWLTPPRLNPAESLPLHVCDLNGLIAPLALLTGRRWLRAVLYFWGIGLSAQGLLQPVIDQGPATSRFWFFFISHALIVGYAVYDVIVGRFRPNLRDFGVVVLASLAYYAVMIPLNIATGWNYGYLGSQDNQPGAIKAMGAWPWRLAVLFGVGSVIFAALWAPWAIVEKKRRG